MAAPEQGVRRLSAVLLAAILVMPVVAAWFLLRRGYSNQLRAAGFSHMGFALIVGLVRAFQPY